MFSSSVSLLVLVLSHSADLQFCGRFAILADLQFLSKGENKHMTGRVGTKEAKKQNPLQKTAWK